MSNHFELRLLHSSARTAVLEIADGGHYETTAPYLIEVNGETPYETTQSVNLLFGLKPDSDVTVLVQRKGFEEDRQLVQFHTGLESVSLNVRDFGAKGDGQSDDTLFIQAAIYACPPDGRVIIPPGTYLFRCLQLKSDLQMYVAKGAVLKAFTDPEKLPVLPGMCLRYDEQGGYNLGTWEGNPLPMYTGLITALNAERVFLYGEGTIDGSASDENWWRKELLRALPARPRLLFLSHCRNVVVQGLLFKNSPSWTIHTYFSQKLSFFGGAVENPAISPNTDGLNPDSCTDVQIVGMRFSLGDDCIAIKSGKIFMARTYQTPSKNIQIRRCLLENGHGAVTIGSELAAGINNVLVEDCLFRNTDRGLRIKTRRGRGDLSVVTGIQFRRIRMEEVLTPFVINSFYFCDPDGHTSYVSSRDALPVDERTPSIGSLHFEDITCENAHFRAAHIEGLPEKKIEQLVFRHVLIRMSSQPKEGVAAMAEDVAPSRAGGMYIRNVQRLVMGDVEIDGFTGPKLDLKGVDQIEEMTKES